MDESNNYSLRWSQLAGAFKSNTFSWHIYPYISGSIKLSFKASVTRYSFWKGFLHLFKSMVILLAPSAPASYVFLHRRRLCILIGSWKPSLWWVCVLFCLFRCWERKETQQGASCYRWFLTWVWDKRVWSQWSRKTWACFWGSEICNRTTYIEQNCCQTSVYIKNMYIYMYIYLLGLDKWFRSLKMAGIPIIWSPLLS